LSAAAGVAALVLLIEFVLLMAVGRVLTTRLVMLVTGLLDPAPGRWEGLLSNYKDIKGISSMKINNINQGERATH